MREILFRAKRKDNGEWVYGNLITDGEDVFVLVKEDLLKGLDVGGWIDGVQTHEVVPKTVGQYTGLTDKNGTKIFEGDIVRVFDGYYINEKVTYDNEFGAFVIGGTNFWYWLPNVEVIGNVHDNLELLQD